MKLFTLFIDYHKNGDYTPRVCFKSEKTAVTKANDIPWPSRIRKMEAIDCVRIKSADPYFNIILH